MILIKTNVGMRDIIMVSDDCLLYYILREVYTRMFSTMVSFENIIHY